MKNVKQITILIFLLFSCASVANALQSYKVSDVPNTKLSDRREFISDPNHFLTPAVAAEINARLLTLMDSTSIEMALVMLPSIGEEDIFDFSQELAESWGIGRDDNDNGLLMLFVMDQRAVRIHPGYGLEGVITDATARHIIDTAIIPWMRKGDVDKAVESGVATICNLLEQPAVLAEVRSARQERTRNDQVIANNKRLFRQMLSYFIAIMLIVGIWKFLQTARKAHKIKNYNYGKAMQWRNALPKMILWTLLSAGLCLPLLICCYLLYRFWRTKKIICDNCHARMRRLPEDKDNNYLTSGEDCEEKLHTVDYDVWLCPECGAIEKFPFIMNQNFYTECPSCHHLAYGLKYDRTVVPSTVSTEGIGERIYECRHCGFNDRKQYRLPKKPDPTVMAAAALAAGAAARSGRGGGMGSGGGSWGGGSFGGGGATGRW